MKEKQVATLADSGLFGNAPLHASLLETHISWVLLSGRFAFKIKKPVKFSFLDFSSLVNRKKFCDKELRLNRRFTDIYLSVQPVKASGSAYRIGPGKGRVIDYAVQMKRMQAAKRMDNMLGAGKIEKRHIVSLAREVSAFHTNATVVSQPFDMAMARTDFNDVSKIRSIVRRRLPDGYGSIIPSAMERSDSFLRSHKARFQSRIAAGFRRDLHGDLHTGNIFLYRRPVLFDCIEFDDAFRQIDVLNEIAFLCMDLEVNGAAALSRLFADEYARRFCCFKVPEDRSLFLYYKFYRANIRAKVHALAAEQEDDPALQSDHLKFLMRYLRQMARYLRFL